MRLDLLPTATRNVMLEAAGLHPKNLKPSGLTDTLIREAWRAFRRGFAVVIDNVTPRPTLTIVEHDEESALLPILRHGLFLVETADDHGGVERTRVLGLSPTLRTQARWIAAAPEDLLQRPRDYQRVLPALSIYGVPWEIAWLRSHKARAAAVAAYRQAVK